MLLSGTLRASAKGGRRQHLRQGQRKPTQSDDESDLTGKPMHGCRRADWLADYNAVRPHSALRYRSRQFSPEIF